MGSFPKRRLIGIKSSPQALKRDFLLDDLRHE
jgi:hypothetical protein